jgi:hypothetical protein
MQDLQEYTENCLYEHAEWKADERAEIRRNHNIAYPKRDIFARPRSWDAEPTDSLPRNIEQSRPLCPALKRRRYRNTRTQRYRTSQPRPQPEPKPPDPDRDDDATSPPATTVVPKGHPSIPMFEGRHLGNNGLARSTHHSNPNPQTNFTSQGHSSNRNKYYYGTHTSTSTTPKRRPPPWPIIPTPTTIFSISNSRPPPWPIICCCQHDQHSPISSTPPARPPPWPIIPRRIQSTPQNRRNAKQRIKAKSRIISDEVSV